MNFTSRQEDLYGEMHNETGGDNNSTRQTVIIDPCHDNNGYAMVQKHFKLDKDIEIESTSQESPLYSQSDKTPLESIYDHIQRNNSSCDQMFNEHSHGSYDDDLSYDT